MNFRRLLDFLFPPTCIACTRTLESFESTVCRNCFAAIRTLNPDHRCPSCFSPLFDHPHVCPHSCIDKYAICLEDNRVTRRLLQHSRCTPALAGLMILQFFSLGWDIPDLIVPTPRNKKSSDSWEIRKALAQHIGNMLQRPVNTQIFLDPSLLISPRKTLEWQKSPSHVALKTHSKFSEKNILIVHDLHISGYAELSTAQFLKRNNSSYIMSMSCLGPSENC